MYAHTVNVCMTQMSATKGIKWYGDRAVTAIFNEFAQLDNSLTLTQKADALRAINFIKEK